MKQLLIKSPAASRLRQRKHVLARRFLIPSDLVGGSFVETSRRCGRQNCRCASGAGHEQWTLTTSHLGKRSVQRIPRDWVRDVERAVAKTQAYLDAVKEITAAVKQIGAMIGEDFLALGRRETEAISGYAELEQQCQR